MPPNYNYSPFNFPQQPPSMNYCHNQYNVSLYAIKNAVAGDNELAVRQCWELWNNPTTFWKQDKSLCCGNHTLD